MLRYLHHVHYVVENLDEFVAYFEKSFGMTPERIEISKGNSPAREAIYHAGITEIQVCEPLDPNSKLAKELAERGPGVTHVGWGITEAEDLFQQLLEAGNVSRRPKVSVAPRGYKTINIEPSEVSRGVGFQLIEDPDNKI